MKRMYGTFEHQLDDKGRMRIPAKFLSVFDKEYENQPLYYVIYAPWRIAIMAESVLDEKMAKLGGIVPLDEETVDAMDAQSKILGTAEDVNRDGQGRVSLPKHLRNEVLIKKDVVTVGMGDYIEIWAKEVRAERVDKMSRLEANRKAFGAVAGLADKS